MDKKVNILFITADQLRYDSLGITGHPLVRTPNLDALAESGALFSNTFVQSAVCGPSRAAMYTGRYTHNNGVRFNEVPFRPGERTIADYFNDHQYRAALVGRTHFTPITEKYGFEYFAYYDGLPVKDAYSAYPEYLKSNGYSEEDIRYRYWPRELEVIPGQEAYPEDFREAYYPSRIAEEHSDTAYLTNEAIRFIRETGDRPWMLHLSYWKPHLPFSVPEPYHSMYDPKDVPMPRLMPDELKSKPPLQKLFREERRGNFLEDERLLRQIRAVYYGMITQLDDHMGRLLEELKQLGIRDNTLIIFTSDHGEYMGDHYMVEKELFYEQAIHVPLMVSLPGRIKPGTVTESFVETVDLLPTCMEAAGLPIPQAVDGRSLFPLLDGTAASWRQEVFAEWDFQYYHARRQLGLNPDQCKAVMVRNKRWKYVHYSDQPCELYDLENDSDEFNNLADDPQNRSLVHELQLKILDWRLRTEDKSPEVDLTFASYLRDPWST
ncbi:sulfatase-like hydrolase/transferase [Cohnella herbarum]|uniref:Sulfatase-like hydrolase/transferase n=1 Tax=Cohnella herbarum TaxID=2728023 RepID=A0A7Z2VKM3_9BACL|nr:sulfatase-like hydrolase/transferase [Cohnella herbarum]QJD84986.1 sulfatase-like hydrolase/transferase [Cohnella herbarum]